MDEIIESLVSLLNNNGLQDIYQKSPNRFYRIKASIHVLENTDDVIAQYENREFALINLYGLLQYLFISIDALYDLAYGILNNKWSININTNSVLRDIKYVRNDVIGHPTNRQYGNKEIGYCAIDFKKTKKDQLVYDTFLPDTVKQTKVIDVPNLIENFIKEYKKTIREIYGNFNKNGTYGIVFLSPIALNILDNYSKGVFLEKDLKKMAEVYQKTYGLEEDSKNRFLWRIEICLSLKEIVPFNNKEAEVLTYLILRQMNKLCLMASDSDYQNYQYQSVRPDFKIKIPSLIHYTRFFIKENEIPIKNVLKDKNHPLFDFYLTKIMKEGNKMVKECCQFLLRLKDNERFLYAIGSEIEREV